MTEAAPAPEAFNPFSETLWKSILESIGTAVQDIGLRILFALIALLIGYIILRIIMFFITRALNAKKDLDVSLKNFFLSCIRGILWLLLITAIIDIINLELLSLAAIIAALGLAVGFAVGGIMSNFVAGIMILARKPFVVGDLIEAQGQLGVVNKIEMFMTTVLSLDNKTITIPNLPLATETVTNYSREKTRRVDLVIGVAYDADLTRTRKVLEKLVKKHSKILSTPKCVINVHELADSSVNFVVRPWCKTADYWTVYWDMHAQAKVALDNAGIGIPFPQRDIHIVDEQDEDAGSAAEAEISDTESVEKTEVSESSEDGVDRVLGSAMSKLKKSGSKLAKGLKKGSKKATDTTKKAAGTTTKAAKKAGKKAKKQAEGANEDGDE